MKLLFYIAILLTTPGFAQQVSGDVIGEVRDEYDFPIYGVHVFIDDVFGQRYQTKTDFDGKFRISQIPVGEYELNLRYMGDTINGIFVEVPRDGFHNCGEILFRSNYSLCICPPIYEPVPMDPFDHTRIELDYRQIQQSANRFDYEHLISGNSSDVQLFQFSNEISIRGARTDSQLQLLDGVKVRGTSRIPSASFYKITVFTNGLPAKYGDASGGVIDIETAGYFHLYREWTEEQLKSGR